MTSVRHEVDLTLTSETELTAALVESNLEGLAVWSTIASGDTIDIIITSTHLTTIKTDAFSTVTHKDKITSIMIPDPVTSIEANAFEGYIHLEHIRFGAYSQLTAICLMLLPIYLLVPLLFPILLGVLRPMLLKVVIL